MNGKLFLTIIIAAISVTACYNIGPKTIPRDRFDYNAAISDSWKEQTLLNIVKLRYADMPLFVDISSVVSGYTLQSEVNILGSRSSSNAIQGNSATVGGSATFTDRPTITYAPITGSQFNKSFMTPIPPRSVLFLLQSGWSADMIFPLTVDSINGLRSQISAGSRARSGDDDYYRVVELIRRMQLNGATGMQLQRDEMSNETALLIIHKSALDQEGKAAFNEFDSLLGLRPAGDRCTVWLFAGRRYRNHHDHLFDAADNYQAGDANRGAARTCGRWSYSAIDAVRRRGRPTTTRANYQ